MCEETEVFVVVYGRGPSPVFVLVAETKEMAKQLATQGDWEVVSEDTECCDGWCVVRTTVWAH